MRALPAGTVTFLFTDVEGSTTLLHELGAERYAEALAAHRRVIRNAFARHGGVEVDTQGDAFFVAFPTAPGALAAASEILAGLAAGPIRVRAGIHTGTPFLAEEGYVGADVHRAARIAACGHGGQVLVSASTASLVGTDGLRDLGEHRLKDLSAPERLFQLGDGDFPPLKSLHQTNLPVPATAFLGRERELAEIAALLAREGVRLVTLVGPGGTGKTRLALQAAAAAAGSFPGGVWWVPLAALRDPGLVLDEAARVVGATGDLAEHIGAKRLLLLFDNFEQVVAAAPDVAHLLQACARLTVLVTSREPLRLDGEWEYAVDPLGEAEAVALFEARASAARRDFVADDSVPAICRRLDNLPLALELAAARVKVLSPAALLERLERRLPVLAGGARDAPERQRTLRATIEWSHDLLTADEQALFRRLAPFAGGATLEACEAVCDADLATLASLVDKSLLRQTDGRFWMLETIREFAEDRLEAAAEAETFRRRHAEYVLALAEELEPALRADAVAAEDRLDREHDNVRAALDAFATVGDTDRLLRLAAAVAHFWFVRGHIREGRRRLEEALRAGDGASAGRAAVLTHAAGFAAAGGDLATALAESEEALALQRERGDARGVAEATFQIGYVLAETGEWRAARDRFEEAIRLAGAAGDEHHVLWATRSLAWTYAALGDTRHARELHEENLDRARALGNDRMTATALGALAMIAVDELRLDDAFRLLGESLRIDHARGDALPIAINISRFANAFAYAGDPATAATLVAAYEAIAADLGASPPWVARNNEETLALVRAQLDGAAFAAAWERGRALTVAEAIELALA